MRIIKGLMIVLVFLLVLPLNTWGWSDWKTIKTEHFTVFYKPDQDALAERVLQTLEYYRPEVEKMCGNELFHLSIVIDDFGIAVNGFSDPINERVHLYNTSPGVGELGAVEDWWSLVGVHEYTHELSLSKTSGLVSYLKSILGNQHILMPNVLAPGWIVEGITVYNESQLSPYQGRLNDGLYDAYMAARVMDNRWPSIVEATYSSASSQFNLTGIYTYGGEFLNYLAKTYGQEKFAEFFKENGGLLLSILPVPALGVDRSAKKVFGKSFPELWGDWRKSETEYYKEYKMDGEQVTKIGWYVNNLAISGEKIYYERTYLDKVGAFNSYEFQEIVERDLKDGTERILVSANAAFAQPFQITNGCLYYSVHEQRYGYDNDIESGLGVYAVVHQRNLQTGKDMVVLQDGLRSFGVLPDGKIVYAKDLKTEFGSEVILLDPVAKAKQVLYKTNYVIERFTCDNKRIVVTARKDWQNFSLYQLNIKNGELTVLVDTPYTESGTTLQDDRLFFFANYQKSIAAYCYDFKTAKVSRLTETGFAMCPVYEQSSLELYFVGLNSYGFDIYRKKAEFTDYQLPDSLPNAPPVFDMAGVTVTKGGYADNLKTLAPKTFRPIINYDDDHRELGFHISGGDAVGDFSSYTASLTYDNKQEDFHSEVMMDVNYFKPLHVTLAYQDLDEKDDRLFGLILEYPFLNKRAAGFSTLAVGTAFNYEEDYDGPEIAPYLLAGFKYPKTNIMMRVSTPYSENKNGIDRTAVYTYLVLKQYLPHSELHFNFININDPDNPDTVFTEIRGYDDELEAKRGQMYTLEYSKPIFKIRKGLWNPNIYFEDITATVFGDEAIPDEGERQASWGLELHLETDTANGLPIDWGVRWARNIDGHDKVGLFVNSIF